MIDAVSNPKCFSAFRSYKHIKEQKIEATNNVKIASLVGAGIGAIGAAYLLARRQSRIMHKPTNLFSIKYNEPELIGVAVSSIGGGLALGGMVDEKKYFPIKVKEAIHQTVANVLAPLFLIGGLNRLYEKHPIKNIPQFSQNTGIKKFANSTIKLLPQVCIATVGLVGGVFLGSIITNKINGIENTQQERHVKTLDFIYHPDDFAAAFAIADKKGVLQKFVNKIIPPIFMLHGYDTGTRR